MASQGLKKISIANQTLEALKSIDAEEQPNRHNILNSNSLEFPQSIFSAALKCETFF